MPVYAFNCPGCGPYELTRPLAEAGGPAPCPRCGVPGRRVWTPPALVRTPAWQRTARSLEERSAHDPEVVSAPSGRPLPHGLRHRHGGAPPWAVAGH